ncbi:hypothetical protein B0J14DRAFT_569046 [Halenospora varia]|nr:hypothetical protein B0J14DRAFT_569046 [Halenospora varia]
MAKKREHFSFHSSFGNPRKRTQLTPSRHDIVVLTLVQIFKGNEEPVQRSNAKELRKSVGILAVCIHRSETGCQVQISYGDRSTTFAWSQPDVHEFPWTVFNEDHTIQVTHQTFGYCVILVYKLYSTRTAASFLKSYSLLDSRNIPLFEMIKPMIGRPEFMRDGRIIGFYYQSPYPESSYLKPADLLRVLTGIDAVVFAAFRSLGLKVDIRSLFNVDWYEGSRVNNIFWLNRPWYPRLALEA